MREQQNSSVAQNSQNMMIQDPAKTDGKQIYPE